MITYAALLKRKEFCYFLVAQFLGAFNDNVYKMVVSLLIIHGALTGELLSITAIVFILPSLFFSGYAGYLADRYSKRTVLILTKATEILALLAAVFALMLESKALMLAVLFAMATKSAFFSPAKYGILPETVSSAELSHANGIVQMSTYLAILLGGVCGGLLLNIWGETPYKIGLVLIGIAIIASLCTLGIARVNAASSRVMQLNPWSEINKGIKDFFKHPLLFWVVMAIAYFWALGLTMQINIVALGHFTLDWSPFAIASMQAMLGVGIGVGSLLAGRMSGDQIEPGLIPLGAILMGVCLLSLSSAQLSPVAIYLLLTGAGLAAGLYIVPLNALLQEIPEASQKGRMIATANFLGAVAMLLAAGMTWVFYSYWELTPKTVLMLMGIGTLLLSLMTLKVFPDFFLRFLTFLITHTLYRVKMVGYPNFPKNGPALLVCNHVSYVDGMILSGAIPRFIRYMILKDFYEHKLLHWLFKLAHAIPVKEGEYEMTLQAFEEVRESLRQGHIVCIFAEGSITRTGQLLPFHKGFERIMKNLPDVPIIPVYIDELWNSIFAFRDGKVIWKLPKRIPIRVTLAFGAPLPGNSNTSTVRQAVQELGAALKFQTQSPKDTLSLRLLHTARWRYFKFCMADPHTSRLSYGNFISDALLLAHYLRTQYADQKMIGVLLPPSVAGATVNVAITLAGKTAINFIPGPCKTDRQFFIEASQTQVIITTRAFEEEINAERSPGVQTVYYEELPQPTILAKKIARFMTFYLPSRWVLKYYGDATVRAHTPAAVCFSRGAQTSIQGAVLSHGNVLANTQSHSYILHLKPSDRMLGVMPFHDAYGYSCTLWMALVNGMGVFYHAYPTKDNDNLGRIMSRFKTSVMFDRVENYTAYLETVRPSHFSYIRCAIVAGEALPDPLADAFVDKFALELLDSYGCVEMGPGIAINVPDVRRPGRIQRGSRPGSAGHPLPGVAVRVVDKNTGKILEAGEEGLLLVRGLGMMQGYLGETEVTQSVMRDGWYVTGDSVVLGADGFLYYKGRI